MNLLAQYDFASLSPSTTANDLTASNCTNGSLSSITPNSILGYTSDPVLIVSPSSGSSTSALAIANNAYFQITITPAAGKQLHLSSLTFNIARGGSSTPRGYDIRSNRDNYAVSLGAADVNTQRPTFTAVTIDLSSVSFQQLRSALILRFYFYVPLGGNSIDVDTISLYGSVTNIPTTTMLPRAIAELLGTWGVGVFGTTTPSSRNIYVGELPQTVEEGIFIIEVPSPPPHQYIDTEYTVLDFWARSSHTDRAHDLLEDIFNNLHRRNSYDANNWHIFFSQALGSIVDMDRDRESGKLFRLSVQFICRNLNNVS